MKSFKDFIFFKGKIMKKTERIIWISIVSLLLFLSLFAIFIKEVHAKNFEINNKYLEKLFTVINVVEKYYVDENIDNEKLINGAIKGLLESLGDPNTVYLSEKDMEELKTLSTGQYGGVGMLISEREKKIVIVSPFEGTPAYKKGIKAGDIILSVDGVALEGKTVDEAANMLRGNPGTIVKIEILSNGVRYVADVKRALIDVPTVKYAVIDGKYGYLRITQFSGKTDEHVKEALKDFKQKKVKGIIVDLRHNPGGLLSQVISIVDYFQSEGVIVSTKGRNESKLDVANASKLKTIVDKDTPVIVLIDRGSASASEIFAGAIKDTNRGILIGEKSFGKGSVQTSYPLDKDGFKLTIAKYYTPSNKVIDGIGIEPDIEVKDPELTDEEKSALTKLFEDKVIDDFASKNTNPTDKEIDNFINLLLSKGYKLPTRYLKRLIKNAVEIDDANKPIYDLEFDIQLQKALELFDKNLIKRDKNKFYLEGSLINKNSTSMNTEESKKKQEINSENVFTLKFKTDSIKIIDNDKKYLEFITKILLNMPDKSFLIVGHTSKEGSDVEQMRLSLKRAEFVTKYLVKKGIPSDHITYMGKGSTEPVAPDDIESNRQKNRRVEIIIIDN